MNKGRKDRRLEDDFELNESLGRDAVGEVFKARDRSTEVEVAVKRFDQWICESEKELLDYEKTLEQLKQEPVNGVPLVVDYHLSSTEAWVASELVTDFVTLDELLTDKKNLSSRDTTEVILGVLESISDLHKSDLVHGGLTPRKILLTTGCDASGVIITDPGQFALWRVKNPIQFSRKKPDRYLGSARFYSPEAALGKPVTVQSDLYTIGLIFYHCIAGKPPFSAKTFATTLKRQVYERPLPPRLFKPGLSVLPAVESLLECVLSKSPDRRFETAAAFYNAVGNLQSLLDGPESQATNKTVPQKAKQKQIPVKTTRPPTAQTDDDDEPRPPTIPKDIPKHTDHKTVLMPVAKVKEKRERLREERQSKLREETAAEGAAAVLGATPVVPLQAVADIDDTEITPQLTKGDAQRVLDSAETGIGIDDAFDKLEEDILDEAMGELAAGPAPTDDADELEFDETYEEAEPVIDVDLGEAKRPKLRAPSRSELPLAESEISGINRWFTATEDDIRDTREVDVPFVKHRWHRMFTVVVVLLVAGVIVGVMTLTNNHADNRDTDESEDTLAVADDSENDETPSTEPLSTQEIGTAGDSLAHLDTPPGEQNEPVIGSGQSLEPIVLAENTDDADDADDNDASDEVVTEPEVPVDESEPEETSVEVAQEEPVPEPEETPIEVAEEEPVPEPEETPIEVAEEEPVPEPEETPGEVVEEEPEPEPEETPVEVVEEEPEPEPEETPGEVVEEEPEPEPEPEETPIEVAVNNEPDESEEADEIDPEARADELTEVAHEALDEANFSLAEELFLEAIELDSGNASAYAGLGDVYFQDSQFENAQRLHERAVRYASRNADYHYRLGMDFFRLGEYGDAIETWERVLELDPENDSARESIGEARRRLEGD